jgi:hypothetical protein
VPPGGRRRRPGTGGPWGTGLLLLGVGIAAQGCAYLLGNPIESGEALRWINQSVPLRWWGLLWIAAGVYSTFRALSPPQLHTDVAPAVAVIVLWSAVYYSFWLLHGLDGAWGREWTSGTAWASLGALVVSWSRCVNPPTGRL